MNIHQRIDAEAEAEAPIPWAPDGKSRLTLLGKTEGKRRRGQHRMR